MIKCKDCREWVQSDTPDIGDCRHSPPVFTAGRVFAVWPSTPSSGGCGKGVLAQTCMGCEHLRPNDLTERQHCKHPQMPEPDLGWFGARWPRRPQGCPLA